MKNEKEVVRQMGILADSLQEFSETVQQEVLHDIFRAMLQAELEDVCCRMELAIVNVKKMLKLMESGATEDDK